MDEEVGIFFCCVAGSHHARNSDKTMQNYLPFQQHQYRTVKLIPLLLGEQLVSLGMEHMGDRIMLKSTSQSKSKAFVYEMFIMLQ